MAQAADKQAVEEKGVSAQPLRQEQKTDDKTANLGPSTPPELRALAEDLPEKDEVQKAMKQAMTAEDPKQEAAGKLAAAEASPNAMDTPSGAGLKAAAGVSNDTERGEAYLKARTARRWGYDA